MILTRPMLCAKLNNLSQLKFPLLASPKIDGIRCLKIGPTAVSRSFKPIRNRYIQSMFAGLPEGVDGELIAGNFQETQSAVMSAAGTPSFEYWIFDWVLDPTESYRLRATRIVQAHWPTWVRIVPQKLIENVNDLLAAEECALSANFEGVCLRSLDGPYKSGRSSAKEGYLWKWKRVETSEAEVVGVEEAEENCNPQTRNVFGLSERKGGKSLSRLKGTLGSLVCRDLVTGVEFGIGTGKGLTAALREELWHDPPIGRVVQYTHQRTGVKDAPRFPSFVGFRDEADL